MTPDDLQPGMYLVGREDGTVEPFFVKVTHGPSLLFINHHPDVTYLVEQARYKPGWWWRRMTVGKLPSDRVLAAMPSLYGWGGM